MKYFETLKPFFSDKSSALFLNDAFEALEQMTPESVDVIFADPPYFLSNDGISCSGGKRVSVNKGDRDKIESVDEKHEFNRRWLRLCKKVLKLNGSIWISGTLHNIYSVGLALEQEGFKIINNITWQKTNLPPNSACIIYIIMNLFFPEIHDLNFKSSSQRVRVLTETWLKNEMYCPVCGCDSLSKIRNNARMADFFCENCGEIYELKSSARNIGKSILDGAYSAAMERINSNTNPNLFVLQYCSSLIENLILVPKYFFTPDTIKERNPLSSTARRAGYVGCVILYENISQKGKIPIIEAHIERDKKSVMEDYACSARLKVKSINKRGWLFEVLACIDKVASNVFSIDDMYKFVPELSAKHPDNKNVEAKIRQQLQFLRDKGFIEFLSPGVYRKILRS